MTEVSRTEGGQRSDPQGGRRRIRIGIDTGGTFTDVVAVDEETGEQRTTKTPSTPSNPADGFINGIEKILGLMGATGDDITAVSHGGLEPLVRERTGLVLDPYSH